MVFVCVCVCVAMWVCGDGFWKAQENQKLRLEKNNKERLKNNILIKIEFWDVGGIVKWYGISNKVAFWDGKIR